MREHPGTGRSEGIDMTESTKTEATVLGTSNDTFTMVVTLKSGAQIRSQVTEYTVGRNALGGGLARLRWTGGEDADAALQFLDLDEVAAVHSEGLQS